MYFQLYICSADWKIDSKTTANYIYIINTDTSQSLALSSSGELIQEDFKKDKSQQLWEKVLIYGSDNIQERQPDAERYFTLRNYENEKDILTLTSPGQLFAMEGNISLTPNIYLYLIFKDVYII